MMVFDFTSYIWYNRFKLYRIHTYKSVLICKYTIIYSPRDKIISFCTIGPLSKEISNLISYICDQRYEFCQINICESILVYKYTKFYSPRNKIGSFCTICSCSKMISNFISFTQGQRFEFYQIYACKSVLICKYIIGRSPCDSLCAINFCSTVVSDFICYI